MTNLSCFTDLDIFDHIGLVGVLATMIGYYFLQTGKIALRGWWYSSLNAIGSFLILISFVEKFNFAAFLMEFIWFFISLYGLFRVMRLRRV
ncbi:MAG: hypothetical protein ACD_44C00432G0004 [uncultured bacterium]|nr:MAG: hypothetical protein ACD_44C00432G0004 [uncultured bacterium]OGT15356.1 MAG: hypothetical protein A3B69_04985 [Gammaproteobacteria bacterium RIFCSPHIGHO2_02_FULL_38_33]OGT24022.1 MAG: hypothetical protein A2W47_05215 [Gammaproteobacteria bacterium RIFCSPHIGHO2_12_38_15]OGT69244.1 MAG: hypothetical protein A3I12_04375 [Gammaproteobacteria bacterium RIFCSPLOWO2_02_FULL_38_11]OGT75213.1 MAG: hypothetical protein A3G71_01430 [Gammaproteobacteria bacterium RIFCSPLOWO2_12_FULL_38_14]